MMKIEDEQREKEHIQALRQNRNSDKRRDYQRSCSILPEERWLPDKKK